MAITATSPAVNRGAGALAADQRGQPRPVAYPGVPFSAAAGANGADIGAFELQAPPPVVPSNRFRFGKVKLNKKKGTATVAVIVPGPGDDAPRRLEEGEEGEQDREDREDGQASRQGQGQGAPLAQEQRQGEGEGQVHLRSHGRDAGVEDEGREAGQEP